MIDTCLPPLYTRADVGRVLWGLNLAQVETTARSPGGRLRQWPTRMPRVPAEACIAASTASLVGSGDGKAFTRLLLPHRVRGFCTAMQTVNLVDGVVLGQHCGLREVRALQVCDLTHASKHC
jgi:hypothetical protein